MKTQRDAFDYVNTFLMLALVIIIIFPIIHLVSLSLSSTEHILRNEVSVWPRGITLGAYELILTEPTFGRSYLNTILYAVVGTSITLTVTMMTAYPLTKRGFPLRKFLLKYYLVTMFFSGGLIPTYLMVYWVGFIDTLWAVTVPTALTVWNLIICRTFLQNIPDSLTESAYMDGAGEWRILLSIVVPLSKPIIAVLVLWSMVGQWNSFFAPMLYLNDSDRWPLQLLLRRLLVSLEIGRETEMFDFGEIPVASLAYRSASIVVTMVPIACIYPFAQSYFVKGIMIGSIKG